jgi:phage N-6-adenine-methyltransferase
VNTKTITITMNPSASQAVVKRVVRPRRHVDQSWFNAKSVEYETPDGIYEPLHCEFGFTLDVASTHENAKCANHYTAVEDGLTRDWSGVCWMNPPYGRVMQKWVRKAYKEWQRGCTVVALIPARTNTGWWHECVQDIATVRFIRGEVAFKGFVRGLWMPMAIVIWPNTELSSGGTADKRQQTGQQSRRRPTATCSGADPEFVCPACGGRHFGRDTAGATGRVHTLPTVRCHDQHHRGCKWSGVWPLNEKLRGGGLLSHAARRAGGKQF